MKTNQPTAPDVIVLAPPSGHLLLYQSQHHGQYHQAMFVERQHVPAFLKDPTKAAVLLIPAFSALALHAHTSMSEVVDINLRRDIAIDDTFEITIQNKACRRIRYYSSHARLDRPRTLVREGIYYVITPRLVAMIDHQGPPPVMATVTQLPRAEPCDYRTRFAHDPQRLRAAAQLAVDNSRNELRYEN